MLGNFFKKAKGTMIKKLMEKQLKGLPPQQRDALIAAFQEKPEFFTKIAEEIKELQKSGLSQMQASMKVMMKHQDELKGIMSKHMK